MPGKRTPPPEPAAPLPDFTSDRMRLMAPMLTPRILDLARTRILTAESFFSYDKLRTDYDETEVRIALMVALEIHPRLELDNNEQGVLRGMTRAAYSKRSDAGDLVR